MKKPSKKNPPAQDSIQQKKYPHFFDYGSLLFRGLSFFRVDINDVKEFIAQVFD